MMLVKCFPYNSNKGRTHTLTDDNNLTASNEENWDLLPLPRLKIWSISKADIPHNPGVLGIMYPVDRDVKALPPLFIVNPDHPQVNQDFAMRHQVPPHNYLPFITRCVSVPPIPWALKEVFWLNKPEDFTSLEHIPPSLPGGQHSICPATRVEDGHSPRRTHPVPTYCIMKNASPTIRIHQDSIIQISSPATGFRIIPHYITGLSVLGSRGLADDREFEILEMEHYSYPRDHPQKYVWLLVQPAYIHPDVVVVIDKSSGHYLSHYRLMNAWEDKLKNARPDRLDTEDQQRLRELAVWMLLYWYILCRRRQCIITV